MSTEELLQPSFYEQIHAREIEPPECQAPGAGRRSWAWPGNISNFIGSIDL
jgi:hypothetical protein